MCAWRMILPMVALLAATVAAAPAPAGSIHANLPAAIDPSGRYLIYLHGRIIEEEGRRPVSPDYGVYEYDKILGALKDAGFTVVSEKRGKGTDVGAYARKVSSQVEALLAKGVAPGRITVAGFSMGGVIALTASSMVKNEDIRFVIMAGCGEVTAERLKSQVHGRILSMYDSVDKNAGSCRDLFNSSANPAADREIVFEKGLGHGAFYRPQTWWLEPLIKWAGI